MHLRETHLKIGQVVSLVLFPFVSISNHAGIQELTFCKIKVFAEVKCD